MDLQQIKNKETSLSHSEIPQEIPQGTWPPSQTKEYLDTIAGGSDRYVVVGMVGSEGGGTIGPRHTEFINACENAVLGDLDADMWTTLQEALEMMAVVCDDLPPPV